jgi:hypothetical protein
VTLFLKEISEVLTQRGISSRVLVEGAASAVRRAKQSQRDVRRLSNRSQCDSRSDGFAPLRIHVPLATPYPGSFAMRRPSATRGMARS